jgi:hypothetical protein
LTHRDLEQVTASGDRRKSLEALRDYLAAELQAGPSTSVAVAPIAKELRAVLEELDSLPTGREESKVDDLAAARAKRRASAAGA